VEKLGHMIEVLDAALLIAAERLWHQNPEGHDSPDSLFRDLIEEAKAEIILSEGI
jgi:hypothetical protein